MAVGYNLLLSRACGRIALVDSGLELEAARQFGDSTGRVRHLKIRLT